MTWGHFRVVRRLWRSGCWLIASDKGTTQTANNPISTAQGSKALDVRYFKVRDYISERKLRVTFLRTHLNVADFFTKNLPDPAFRNFRRTLMGFHNHEPTPDLSPPTPRPLTKKEQQRSRSHREANKGSYGQAMA